MTNQKNQIPIVAALRRTLLPTDVDALIASIIFRFRLSCIEPSAHSGRTFIIQSLRTS